MSQYRVYIDDPVFVINPGDESVTVTVDIENRKNNFLDSVGNFHTISGRKIFPNI